MCMEDVRLGRMMTGEEINTVVGLAATPVIDFDTERSFILFSPPLSGIMTFSIFPTMVAGSGLNIAAGQDEVSMDIQTHGNLVTKAWFAIHSVGGIVATVYIGRLDKK